MSSEEGTKYRRNVAPFILLAVVVILAIYYAVIANSGLLNTTTRVPLQGAPAVTTGDYLTLQMRTQDIDLTNRLVEATILPIPHGRYVGTKPGEMSKSLRIEVASGGVTTSVVTFPGQSIVDPTTLTLQLDRGDTAYPFDDPSANFQLSVQDDETGKAVPFDLTIDNSARPWELSAAMGDRVNQGGRDLQAVKIDGKRDPLSISLVMFYVIAILLTTLIAVVTIGTAIIRRTLDFSNVIWLSATMISFPTLRSAMPGAPPIGTALDFIVFFPCIVMVAGLLVWTGAYMLWRESRVLRTLRIDDSTKSEPTELPAPD